MTLVSGGPQQPHFLIVPGLNDSGPTHWQSRWLDLLRNASKAELGNWSAPDRAGWTAALDRAVDDIDAPIILVAHSLGCHAVAHWATDHPATARSRIFAALLVAPPDCDQGGGHRLVRRFGPSADSPLPFPTTIAASRNDDYASLGYARGLSRVWQTDFIDVGDLGHINAASELGIWPAGLAMLGRLIAIAGFGRKARLALQSQTAVARDAPFRAAA